MKKTQAIINVESAVVEVHSKTLFERVSDYLTEKDWGFNSYEEKTYFTLNLRLTSGTVRVVIDIAESSPWARILVYATYPTFVPPHRRVEVIDAINRINYSLLAGCLEMDAKDGEVRARMMLESDTFVSEQMIDRAMRYWPLHLATLQRMMFWSWENGLKMSRFNERREDIATVALSGSVSATTILDNSGCLPTVKRRHARQPHPNVRSAGGNPSRIHCERGLRSVCMACRAQQCPYLVDWHRWMCFFWHFVFPLSTLRGCHPSSFFYRYKLSGMVAMESR